MLQLNMGLTYVRIFAALVNLNVVLEFLARLKFTGPVPIRIRDSPQPKISYYFADSGGTQPKMQGTQRVFRSDVIRDRAIFGRRQLRDLESRGLVLVLVPETVFAAPALPLRSTAAADSRSARGCVVSLRWKKNNR